MSAVKCVLNDTCAISSKTSALLLMVSRLPASCLSLYLPQMRELVWTSLEHSETELPSILVYSGESKTSWFLSFFFFFNALKDYQKVSIVFVDNKSP